MLEVLFEDEADEVGRKAIALAKEGRVDAIRLVLDRACPARKHRFVEGLTLPKMETSTDAVKAMAAITAAVADGVLTIAEARGLTDIVERFRKALEIEDIERRLSQVERKIASGALSAR